jgi:formiminotetrahydrofolate cyclodeaminase
LNGICKQLLKRGLAHNVADVHRAHFLHAAIYATNVQLQAIKDKEIDQLEREIEAIKKHVGMV